MISNSVLSSPHFVRQDATSVEEFLGLIHCQTATRDLSETRNSIVPCLLRISEIARIQ